MNQREAPHPPLPVPWHGWSRAIRRAGRSIVSDRVGLFAAGCAFWATLALFPAIGTLVSLYGLLFDVQTVEPQLALLRGVLPPAAYALIHDRVHVLVSHGSTNLGVSLLVSTAIAFWSASTGTKSMLAALNLAYEAREARGLLAFQATGLVLTFGGILAALLGLVLLVGLPPLIDFVGLSAYEGGLAQTGAVLLLVLLLQISLAMLYRFGPSRRPARWQWVTPGSLLATVLWLAASLIVPVYVGHLASYDATYGPLAAVAGMMLWFFVSAYAVLIGAELNAALEAGAMEDRRR